MTKEEFLKKEAELYKNYEQKEAYRNFLEENISFMEDDDIRRRISLRHYTDHVRGMSNLTGDTEDVIRLSISNYDYVMHENLDIADEIYWIRHEIKDVSPEIQMRVFAHCVRLINSISAPMKKKDKTIKTLIELKEKKE